VGVRLLIVSATAFLAVAFQPPTAVAIMSGDESPRAESGDKDYAAGKRAFEREDWSGVADNMKKVLERRPWHDNAWSLLGYAERKLGNYRQSLRSYGKALELNPHNRGALEYLGEAYLDLDQPERAAETLELLRLECNRVKMGFNNGGWFSGCEEWRDLRAAYDDYLARRPSN